VNRGDSTDLAMVRRLLGEAAKRVVELDQGQDHPRIQAAQDLIESAIVATTRAAGGLSAWTRTLLDALLLAVIAWGTATVCGLVGLPSGWTIAVTVLAVLAVVWPVYKLYPALTGWVNRRRLGPSAPRVAWPPTDITPAEQVLRILAAARSALAVTMRRRAAADPFGYAARTAAGFNWVRRRDTGLYFASLADRCVCQAICSLERWLHTVERDR
jgi:hypothetical protein